MCLESASSFFGLFCGSFLGFGFFLERFLFARFFGLLFCCFFLGFDCFFACFFDVFDCFFDDWFCFLFHDLCFAGEFLFGEGEEPVFAGFEFFDEVFEEFFGVVFGHESCVYEGVDFLFDACFFSLFRRFCHGLFFGFELFKCFVRVVYICLGEDAVVAVRVINLVCCALCVVAEVECFVEVLFIGIKDGEAAWVVFVEFVGEESENGEVLDESVRKSGDRDRYRVA